MMPYSIDITYSGSARVKGLHDVVNCRSGLAQYEFLNLCGSPGHELIIRLQSLVHELVPLLWHYTITRVDFDILGEECPRLSK